MEQDEMLFVCDESHWHHFGYNYSLINWLKSNSQAEQDESKRECVSNVMWDKKLWAKSSSHSNYTHHVRNSARSDFMCIVSLSYFFFASRSVIKKRNWYVKILGFKMYTTNLYYIWVARAQDTATTI